MKTFKEIVRLPEFERDLKKLIKRFRTLEDDLNNFIKIELNLYHKLDIDNKGIFQITGVPFMIRKSLKRKNLLAVLSREKVFNRGFG